MKTIQTVLLGGAMAFALAACNTTDTTSGSSSTVGATGTGNPTIDAQMGVNPATPHDTGAPMATGSAATPTNTGHTTTSSDVNR